ncbi:MAG: SDR family NAD(P)-dependent oxidoreductase [Streptosporangiaceae bacterium]
MSGYIAEWLRDPFNLVYEVRPQARPRSSRALHCARAPRFTGGTMNEAEPAVPGAGTNDRWRLDGRVALVTGASAGPGARFARVLHAAGAHVIATARRADLLEELLQHCGNRMQTIVGDWLTAPSRSPSATARCSAALRSATSSTPRCSSSPPTPPAT